MNTTLDPQTIAALARELYDARKSRTQLRHFSKRHPGMSIDFLARLGELVSCALRTRAAA